MLTDIARLTESPGPLLKHPHTGANYHEGEAIISHLNHALGPDGWDWDWLDQGIDAEADEVWVLGRLTARFVVLNPAEEGVVTTCAAKTVKGWQGITRSKTSGKAIDLGNNYKAADTDALKRAARLLGVGLDAWAKNPQQQQRAPQKPKAPQAVKPTPETAAAAQLTGAPPQAPTCDAAFFTRKWHATVKGTRFEQDDVRAKFMAWYSDNATESLSAWLKDATEEEAETLVATVKDRIEREAQRATA